MELARKFNKLSKNDVSARVDLTKNNNRPNKVFWSESFNWKYGAYPFFTSVYTKLNTPPANKYETQWKHFLNKFENAQLDAYLPKKEILEKGKVIIDELLSGDGAFLRALDQYSGKISRAIGLCASYADNAPAGFRKIWTVIQDALSDSAKILFNFDYGLDDFFKKLQAADPDLFKTINSHIAGLKESFINEANNKLFELSKKYPDDFDKVYKNFIPQYGWFQNSYKGQFDINKDWLREYLKKNTIRNDSKFTAKNILDDKYRLLIGAANVAVSFRDDKKKLLLLAVEIMDKWLDAVCAEKNLNKRAMLWLSVDEIFTIIDRGDSSLVRRAEQYDKNGVRYGLMAKDGYDDVDEEIWSGVVILNKADANAIEVKGITGNKGRVRGMVRVVLDLEKEGKNFLDGEILVTSMTRPEYLSLMAKSSAFVTNEGGITCHAAIVAREMNKPCVIGTRIATQVLSDGDLVEVDATHAVVRIIKKAAPFELVNTDSDFKLIEEKNKDEFIKKLKNIDWLYWLNRPYSVFMATIFWEGLRHKYFEKNGFKGFGPDNAFYQFPDIYYDKKFLENGLLFFGEYFKDHKVSDLSNSLAAVHKHHLVEIEKITNDGKKTLPQKTSAMSELVKDYMPYLWIIIQLEVYFDKRVAREVPKYIKGDYSKFVGDICVPRKKNAYVLMQDEIRSGAAAEVIQKKYGWIKSRDGFTDFFTVKEIEGIKNDLKYSKSPDVDIPDGLADLAEELKELNFFRTDRTDKFYEFFGAARPLMLEIAKYVGVDFKTLADYDAISIISGQPKKYNKNFSYGLLGNRYFATNDLIIADFKSGQKQEVKGNVAFKGVVRGIARIVTHPNDIGKVGEGDVLVAQMTFPSFISAMQKSVAFVTDEGGITCHAAIIAREMKKPCIIGTKNGTKILHDGDLVEVDADNGVVKILKKGKIDDNNPSTTPSNVEQDLSTDFLRLINGKKLYPPLNNYSTFIQGSGYNVFKYFGKWYGNTVSNDMLVLMKSGFSQVWLSETDTKLTSELALKEFIASPKKFEKRLKIIRENAEETDRLYEKYSYKKIFNSAWNELISLVDRAKDLIWDANAAVFFTIYLDKDFCWDILKSVKYNITKEELDAIWPQATEPAFESFDKVQFEHFLKLLGAGKKLEEIAEECQYFQTDYFSAKSLEAIQETLKNKYARFINDKKLAEKAFIDEKEKLRAVTLKHEQWRSSLPKNEKMIADYLQLIMKIRDRRKNFFAKGLTVIYRIAEKMFKEADLPLDLIPFYTMQELVKGPDYLKNNVQNLFNRKNGFQLLIPSKGDVKMLLSPINTAVDEVNSYYLSSESSESNGKTLKGQIGCKGIVRGKVRIVLNVNSEHGFVDGEILVTGMTRPEYVPLMKKAAGIITDEGGITCHAAIVSRELKIPCITGTKIATKVLHEGDLVEVDADNGVVKIIEKAKETAGAHLIDFKDRKWVVYGVTGCPAYLTPHLYVPSRVFYDKYGISNDGIGLWKGKVMDWLYDENQLVELAEKLLPDLLKRKWEYYDFWKIKADEFDKLHYELYGLDVSKLSETELKSWLKKYYDAFVAQYAENNFIEPLSFYFQNHLKSMLVKEGIAEHEAERLAGLYGAPSKPNYIKECIKEYKKAKSVKALAAVLNKFHFINNDYTGSREVTKADLKQLALKHSAPPPKKIKKGELTEQANDLLQVLQLTATIQDVRKAESLMWVTGAEKLLREFAKRINAPYANLLFATWDEVAHGDFDQAELKRRMEHCVMDWQAKATNIYSGDAAEKIAADFRETVIGATGEINELRGFAASRGKVTGRAAVVLNVSQFNKVDKGDILVAGMTRPEYLPIMHLAAAFVTDEGGITSHAAIVAREMKKPCVIATKIATKVIHDGDLLEVDANKGIIKILKNGLGTPLDEKHVSIEAENDIYKFANLKYHYIHNRTRAPIFTYLLWEGVCHRHNKQTKFDYPIRNIIYLDSDLAIDEAEWDKKAKMTDGLFKKDNNLLNKLIDQARRSEAEICGSVKRLKTIKKINTAAVKELERFFEKTYQFGAFVLFALLAENTIEKRLREIVEKRFGKGRDDVFQILTSPLDLSAVQENELGILKIANLPKSKVKKAVTRHLNKYAWLKNGPYNGTFYSPDDILAEIKKINNPKEALAKYLSGRKAKHENFERYFKRLSKEEASLVNSSLGSINFRSWRTERYYAHGFEMDGLYRKLGEKLGLDNYKDIFYLTPPEIIGLLKTGSFADQQTINERKSGYVMVTDKVSTRIYSGAPVVEFKKRVNVKPIATASSDIIKGQIAYPGKVTGKARIVHKKADLAAVQDGDILVAEMTTPDFVPFLKKTVGIVTNEGGITCHAAIIAREMKKPCVIGTKIATHILKNGDLVEVDAEKGIVKILKKA